eukprot:TRINITY_DN151_c0_g1_i1.p1 TRINITY_DN151_c0_g1~~TRINITY_DN151_c0_g1_i1.p1  ORF type:complete len:546 (+),score=169.92 TRINITY_DN151_c0_g1_i1:65-1702(+)
MRRAAALLLLLLPAAAGVVQGGDFEVPRVSQQRQYRPLYPWWSRLTAIAPYPKIDPRPTCSGQRQFVVCKGNLCWIKLSLRTRPGSAYRLQYAADEQVFKGCLPDYCATLPAGPKPLECLPCDKPHGLKIDDDERRPSTVAAVAECGVVPVFTQYQLDFVAAGMQTTVTWFPKNVSANPRGHMKIDRVSAFLVCGSDLIPIDESLLDPSPECPPTPAPTPAPPTGDPSTAPSGGPSSGPSAAPFTPEPTWPPSLNPSPTPTGGKPPAAPTANPSEALLPPPPVRPPASPPPPPPPSPQPPVTSPPAPPSAAPSETPSAGPHVADPGVPKPPSDGGSGPSVVVLAAVIIGAVAGAVSLIAWCVCAGREAAALLKVKEMEQELAGMERHQWADGYGNAPYGGSEEERASETPVSEPSDTAGAMEAGSPVDSADGAMECSVVDCPAALSDEVAAGCGGRPASPDAAAAAAEADAAAARERRDLECGGRAAAVRWADPAIIPEAAAAASEADAAAADADVELWTFTGSSSSTSIEVRTAPSDSPEPADP